MEKLRFQDAFYLRAESANCPFHVGGVMIFEPPPAAGPDYLRRLASKLARQYARWPDLNRQLVDAGARRQLAWESPPPGLAESQLLHYRLPAPGRTADLLKLIARAHEQHLDRSRPLWQAHLIEGLPRGRFALYLKFHHALIDGVNSIRLVQQLLSTSPRPGLARPPALRPRQTRSLIDSIGSSIGHSLDTLLKQAQALPELSTLMSAMGRDALSGRDDVPQLPFSAPHTILNGELNGQRSVIVSEFSLSTLRRIGQRHGGTINDALVAICGGALRSYLLEQNALPRRALEAGMPVAIRRSDDHQGNSISYMVCPFGTHVADPDRRLQLVIRATRKAKSDLGHVTPTATEDFANVMMLPYLVLTMTHMTQRLPPPFNAIVSNVPGPRQTLYLDGSRLEKMYPIPVITDGMGLNITVISYGSKMYMGVLANGSTQPGIERLDRHLQRAYQDLRSERKRFRRR